MTDHPGKRRASDSVMFWKRRAGDGLAPAAAMRSLLQYRHLIAASWISSAQKGHFFIVLSYRPESGKPSALLSFFGVASLHNGTLCPKWTSSNDSVHVARVLTDIPMLQFDKPRRPAD